MARNASNYMQDRIQGELDQQIKPPPKNQEPPSDSDFKSFVMYIPAIERRDNLSNQALTALVGNPGMKVDTMIQIVDQLRTRPAWLDTLPCLVVKSEKRVYKGSACVDFILTQKNRMPSGKRGCGTKNLW